MRLTKVISGGQTGVDRAGLDSAHQAGILIGGYCPKGRKAEDGTIPERYPLEELTSAQYTVRTEKNVTESDGTLILNKGVLSTGTRLTHEYTVKHGKPHLIVQLEEPIDPADVMLWIRGENIHILNIAGPRESKVPEGIYNDALLYLNQVFTQHKQNESCPV
jgi:hypothetical protein